MHPCKGVSFVWIRELLKYVCLKKQDIQILSNEATTSADKTTETLPTGNLFVGDVHCTTRYIPPLGSERIQYLICDHFDIWVIHSNGGNQKKLRISRQTKGRLSSSAFEPSFLYGEYGKLHCETRYLSQTLKWIVKSLKCIPLFQVLSGSKPLTKVSLFTQYQAYKGKPFGLQILFGIWVYEFPGPGPHVPTQAGISPFAGKS